MKISARIRIGYLRISLFLNRLISGEILFNCLLKKFFGVNIGEFMKICERSKRIEKVNNEYADLMEFVSFNNRHTKIDRIVEEVNYE